MKSSVAFLLLVAGFFSLSALPAQYRTALPGYRYEFPRDHFSHPDFQTEWWYYTGNLTAADGRHYGFELTFFRHAPNRDASKIGASRNGAWDVRDVYLAHLALSDLDGGKFYHTERINRSGPGIAGISEPAGRIWNGNWQITMKDSDQELQAISEQFQMHLSMHSEKQPVVHGQNGISQKASGAGHASHYISLTRLGTTGSIELFGKKVNVHGLAWMDHEFFTQQLSADQVGWDWLSIQLDNNTELMLFVIRRKDGSIDPFSAGTFVDSNGHTTHLSAKQFTIQPLGDTWTSAVTRAVYPIHWKISVPTLGIDMAARTPLAAQEMTGKTRLTPNYWEGAIVLSGTESNHSRNGVGYLEMTGYDRPVGISPLS